MCRKKLLLLYKVTRDKANPHLLATCRRGNQIRVIMLSCYHQFFTTLKTMAYLRCNCKVGNCYKWLYWHEHEPPWINHWWWLTRFWFQVARWASIVESSSTWSHFPGKGNSFFPNGGSPGETASEAVRLRRTASFFCISFLETCQSIDWCKGKSTGNHGFSH